jgi:hypothetical protein
MVLIQSTCRTRCRAKKFVLNDFNFGAPWMKAKRSAARGPLLTLALMIGSVLVVVGVARYFDSHGNKATAPAVEASTNGGSAPTTGQ